VTNVSGLAETLHRPAAGDPGPGAAITGTDASAVSGAERLLVLLLGALRGLTLVLGIAELRSAVIQHHLREAALVLTALACVSVVTFGRAVYRVQTAHGVPFDAAAVWTETITGVAALLLLGDWTQPSQLGQSGFWIAPYTVISAVIIGAAARPWAGMLAAAALTVGYLVAVLTALGPLAGHGHPQIPVAIWTNASSYLLFYAVAAMGFRLLHNIANQAGTLRLAIAQLAEEQQRYATAEQAWRIGHDNPKALLREVRRPVLPAAKLRELAPVFRVELLAELTTDPRAPVVLRDELARVTATFSQWVQLDTDLTGITAQPPGLPALLLAEAARELLNNASYHRYGYPVSLIATASAEAAQIKVHNGGPGIDPLLLASAWARKHNTIHQLETAGGGYQIHSSPGSDGTTIILRYPAAAARSTSAH